MARTCVGKLQWHVEITSHTNKVGQDRLRESSVKYELSVWKRKTALVSTPCRHVNVFIENEIG